MADRLPFRSRAARRQSAYAAIRNLVTPFATQPLLATPSHESSRRARYCERNPCEAGQRPESQRSNSGVTRA